MEKRDFSTSCGKVFGRRKNSVRFSRTIINLTFLENISKNVLTKLVQYAIMVATLEIVMFYNI